MMQFIFGLLFQATTEIDTCLCWVKVCWEYQPCSLLYSSYNHIYATKILLLDSKAIKKVSRISGATWYLTILL